MPNPKNDTSKLDLSSLSLQEIKAVQRTAAAAARQRQRLEGVGSPIGPRNATVQQLAGWMLYELHDRQRLSFEKIGEMMDPPVSGETIRSKYHELMKRYSNIQAVGR